MANVKLVILIDRNRRDAIEMIAADLDRCGLKIDRKMPVTGIIAGWAAPERIEALRRIDGVIELREEQGISLPPMDDDVPQ